MRHILPNRITVHKYHGTRRETDPTKLRDFDIVFTTYATIAAEFCKGTSVIHQLEYYRLVLDEGKNMVLADAERWNSHTTTSISLYSLSQLFSEFCRNQILDKANHNLL